MSPTATQRLCFHYYLGWLRLFKLETLAPSWVLRLKHDCSTTKCRIQGNVTSNWYSSCPAHLSTARCDFPASLATCLLFHFAYLVPVIWSLLDMDLSCHPLATECLILTSCVTSQPTACPGLHFTFLELLPHIYHYCSKFSGEKF